MTPAAALGDAHRQQFLIDADVLPVAAGERARGQHLVGERHEEQSGRGRRERDDVLPRRARNAQVGQAGRDLPDDRDAVLVESERLGGHDRGDHDDQRGGQPRRHVAGGEQQRQGRGADGERRRVHVPDLANHLGELRHRVGRVDVDPGELAELADDQHDRDTVDVADEHGSGEVVGQPAEPEQPRDQKARRDQQRHRAGQLEGVGAAGGGERQHGRRHERRQRALRSDDQLSR